MSAKPEAHAREKIDRQLTDASPALARAARGRYMLAPSGRVAADRPAEYALGVMLTEYPESSASA